MVKEWIEEKKKYKINKERKKRKQNEKEKRQKKELKRNKKFFSRKLKPDLLCPGQKTSHKKIMNMLTKLFH